MEYIFFRYLTQCLKYTKKRGGRAVEGARLESVYTFKRIEGSNPFLSAKFNVFLLKINFYIFNPLTN